MGWEGGGAFNNYKVMFKAAGHSAPPPPPLNKMLKKDIIYFTIPTCDFVVKTGVEPLNEGQDRHALTIEIVINKVTCTGTLKQQCRTYCCILYKNSATTPQASCLGLALLNQL